MASQSHAAPSPAAPLFESHQPTTESLELQFTKQKAHLEHMLVMFYEDSNMIRVAPDFTWTRKNKDWPRPEAAWGISGARWDEYKHAFIETGVNGGMLRADNSSDIDFLVWSGQVILARKTVGFVFCGHPGDEYEHTEIPCLEENDSGEKKQEGSVFRYSKIAADWYVYEKLD